MALGDDGIIYSWGGTLHKKLGQRKEALDKSTPSPVEKLKNKFITFIDCGDFHSVALDNKGVLYTWGGGGASYNKG